MAITQQLAPLYVRSTLSESIKSSNRTNTENIKIFRFLLRSNERVKLQKVNNLKRLIL